MRFSIAMRMLPSAGLLPVVAGGGDLYLRRPSGTVQEFERDGLFCVDEARTAKYGVSAENL